MDQKTTHRIAAWVLLSGLFASFDAFSAGGDPAKAEKPKKIYYEASIIQEGRPGLPVIGVRFYIKEFSTAEEAKKLASTLEDSGQEGLSRELSKMVEKGNISIGNSLGYRIGFIRQISLPDGGWIIRMATDRPLSIPELWAGSRSTDYNIGVVELKLNAEGKGEGALIYAAKVKFNERGMLEIETFGIAPARLVNLRRR